MPSAIVNRSQREEPIAAGFCPKLCILTETYFPIIGGGEVQVKLLGETFSSQGVPVIVLTRQTSRDHNRHETMFGIAVFRVGPTGKSPSRKWGMLVSVFPTLIGKRSEYDIILVSGFRILGIPAVIASKLLRKICILKADSPGEMSGAFFKDGLSRLGVSSSAFLVKLFLSFRNRVLRTADGFVAISSDLASELRSAGISVDRVTQIPNCIDTERFKPVGNLEKRLLRAQLSLPPDRPIVIYTGRLVNYKGLPYLLRAWKTFAQCHDSVLLLVGSGGLDTHNCEQQLREFVSMNNLEGRVAFAGEKNNVDEYLKASDIFVFPTEHEAFGLSLIEAMACGLPVVTTPVGVAKDIIRMMENGLLVNVGDENQLCWAIEKLVNDKSLSSSLGRAARETVEMRFRKEVVVQDYLRQFAEIAGRKKR
jgi:glycosyltransferase involved in cell wall biosynthesis